MGAESSSMVITPDRTLRYRVFRATASPMTSFHANSARASSKRCTVATQTQPILKCIPSESASDFHGDR